ncbi:bZIP transcription factor [Colletotrichum truncatum]|uniref:BZIP transcription factor n=1 Tax=Colletotrichum truncatum TaxID=5467 RepID=A0ACC3YEM1_COLTU
MDNTSATVQDKKGMESTPEVPQTPDTRNYRSPATVSSSRLKKREADRKAQRIAREKTKNRIAHLESLVEELSQKDDDGKTASLMAQLSRVTEQRNKLMSCLETTSSLFTKQLTDAKGWDSEKTLNQENNKSIPDLVNLDLPQPSTLDFMAPPVAAPVPTTSEVTMCDLKHMGFATSNFTDGTGLEFEQSWLNEMFLPETTEVRSSLIGPLPPSPAMLNPTTGEASTSTAEAPPKPTCSCKSSIKKRRLSDGSLVNCNNWKAANKILKEPFAISQAMLDLEYQVSEDIPVHAVLHGWDSISQSGKMTPLWKRVRQLDEMCFSGCGQPERLGVLFMIHLLMRAYTDPTPMKSSVVPQWYLKS